MKMKNLSSVLAGVVLSLMTAMPASSAYAVNHASGAAIGGVAPSDDTATGTKFVTGKFADALAQAKREGKKLMVDCYTLWCGPCRYMAKNVFPDEKLGQYINERFVCIKIDMEHGEGPDLNKTWDVKAYPTFIFFDADGKEMSRFEGMAMQEEFQKRCDRILAGKSPIDEEAEAKAQAERQQQAQKAPKDTIIDEGKGVVFISGKDTRFADVLAKAKQENKRVLVDFWADWCHACIQMNKTTFRDTRVGNMLNLTFVNYAVNMDTDPDGKDMVEKYNINAFPTYLLLNPDGTEYNRVVGSRPVEDFATSIKDALLGKEDESVKMDRLQREAMAKAKAERQASLTATARTAPKVKTVFMKGQDVDKALKTAKAKKRNLMVFVSDGDYKSDYMEKYGFDEATVADYLNSNYICLYVDAKSVAGNAVMEKYELQEMFPGYMLFNAKGDYKGCVNAILRTGKSMKEMFEMYLNYEKL